MSIQDFITNYRQRIDNLNRNRTDEVRKIALDLSAQIKLRIQSDGKDFQEQPFSAYTTSYANVRQELGYQVDYKDYTRTGKLMANVQPYVLEEDETKTVIEITARNEDDQLKLRGARRKDGNILLPTESEIELARQANIERIRKYLGI